MALVLDKNTKAFDLAIIGRGDCMRIKRTDDTVWRNGFVTRTNPQAIEIIFSNVQNNATSFMQITASDVALGVWEVFWTTDFQTIHYENNAPGGGENA